MKIAGDTHTHTVACQHAYSTIDENARWASKIGHKFLSVTEHGPQMPCGPHEWFLDNICRTVPRILHNVVIIRGCEADVLPNGELDVKEKTLKELDWVIASMHQCLMPNNLTNEEYTNIWLKIAENPYVDCIGHMGQPMYKCDYERVIKAFAKNNKVVEINNNSFFSRKGSEENCIEIAKLCKAYGTKVVASSDAHFYEIIGKVDKSIEVLESLGYTQEDLLNGSYTSFKKYLENKKGINLPNID